MMLLITHFPWVTLVWLLSIVCFQMSPQIACLRRGKVTLLGCICLIFLHCVFWNVFSNHLPERMHNHIGCICLNFLQCVFSDVPSNCLTERIHAHINCICLTSLHYLFGSWELLSRRYFYSHHTDPSLPRCPWCNRFHKLKQIPDFK